MNTVKNAKVKRDPRFPPKSLQPTANVQMIGLVELVGSARFPGVFAPAPHIATPPPPRHSLFVVLQGWTHSLGDFISFVLPNPLFFRSITRCLKVKLLPKLRPLPSLHSPHKISDYNQRNNYLSQDLLLINLAVPPWKMPLLRAHLMSPPAVVVARTDRQ